jgi:hypothetical protein
MGDGLQQFLPFGWIIDLGEFLRQVQVIPADDAILDEPFAGFGAWPTKSGSGYNADLRKRQTGKSGDTNEPLNSSAANAGVKCRALKPADRAQVLSRHFPRYHQLMLSSTLLD